MFKNYRHNAFYTLSLLFFIYMFDFADRKIMAALFPFIDEQWDLSYSQLSMLGGIVSIVVAICVIPMAILVDRWSRKKMVALMVFIWSVMTLLCAFAENYTQLLIFRGLIGVGEAAYAPAAIAMISKVFPAKHRGKYIGIYDAAAPLGIALGMIVGGYIGASYGWRYAFGVVAIPGIILSVLFLFVKDYKTLPIYQGKDKTSFSLQSLTGILEIKTLLFVFIAFAFVVGVNTSVIDWLPTYFHEFHGIEKNKAGGFVSVMAITALIGAPLGGVIADRVSVKIAHGKILVSAISVFFAGIFLFCAYYSSQAMVSLIFFSLFGLCTVACIAPLAAVIQELVQPGLRSVAYAVNVVFMNIFGSFLFIYLVGVISDMYNLRFALFLLPIAMICAALLFYISKKSYLHDYKKVTEGISKE